MNETYSTQRALINETTRNLNLLLLDWPFLKIVQYLFEHGSKLLGKDIGNIWLQSMTQKIRPICQDLRICKNNRKYEIEIATIMTDCTTAMIIRVVFSLPLLHFREKEQLLYKIIDVSIVSSYYQNFNVILG